MKQRIWSILILMVMMLTALMPTMAFAADGKATVNGVEFTDFMKAVKAATGTAYPVEVDGEMVVSGSFPDDVNVKIVGTSETAALNLGSDAHTAQRGVMTFENIKLIKANVNYAGFHHAAKVTYNDCVIEGEYWTYAPDTTFNRCTFVQTSVNNYNLWTYGATVST